VGNKATTLLNSTTTGPYLNGDLHYHLDDDDDVYNLHLNNDDDDDFPYHLDDDDDLYNLRDVGRVSRALAYFLRC
jgi:hypothetical protein